MLLLQLNKHQYFYYFVTCMIHKDLKLQKTFKDKSKINRMTLIVLGYVTDMLLIDLLSNIKQSNYSNFLAFFLDLV